MATKPTSARTAATPRKTTKKSSATKATKKAPPAAATARRSTASASTTAKTTPKKAPKKAKEPAYIANTPKTVEGYLASLEPERRAEIETLRAVILANLDKGYEEGMQYGGISYYVPHSLYPAGYHCDPKQPLTFAGLASRKGSISLALMGIYYGPSDADGLNPETRWLQKAWAASGKKLDMGKACIHIKRIADAPLDVIGEAIRRVPAKEFIRRYEAALAASGKPRK